MNISLYQADWTWENPRANCEKAEKWIASQQADLLVLPEMFSTGFSMSPEKIAEPMNGPTVQWLITTAQKAAKAIVCSIAIVEQERYYNRLFFVFPDGSFRTYDKHHLFRMGKEDQHYTAGEERVIVEYKGIRIMPLVCYDLRFPVWSRNRCDYDMLIYIASWPGVRAAPWSALLRARAIENQCYVAAVNRVGSDPTNTYSGDSVLLDFKGEVLAAADPGMEQSITGEIDLVAQQEFIRKFPAWMDADNFRLL